MIQLHPSLLILRRDDGEYIPCSAEQMTIELVGPLSEALDPEVIHNVAAAVLHYFRQEVGRETVTVAEFSQAMERVLRCMGIAVKAQTGPPAAAPARRVEESSLEVLASGSAPGFELGFFSDLRSEMQQRLSHAPQVIRFTGLRNCVKQLTGTRRWNKQCQDLNDRIVDYLRNCLTTAPHPAACALVVS